MFCSMIGVAGGSVTPAELRASLAKGPTAVLYARLATGDLQGEDEILALREFRDALVREGVGRDSPVWMFAQRTYWLRLADAGLSKQVLEEAQALSEDDLRRVLDGETSHGALRWAGLQLPSGEYAKVLAQNLQIGWLGVLLEAGKRDEALQWIERWHWGAAVEMAPPKDSHEEEMLEGWRMTRDVTRRLVADAPEVDAYDVFADYYLTTFFRTIAVPQKLFVDYLDRHGYQELGEHVREMMCRPEEKVAPAIWDAFPADVRQMKVQVDSQVAAATQSRCPSTEGAASEIASVSRKRVENPLPAKLRWSGPRGAAPAIPKEAQAGLAAYNVVRYSASGDQAAAISLSQTVDPVGELGEGGYWLHLSEDGGRSWGQPLYLGLQQFEPYVVVSQSRLPLIAGRRVQIEVEVREIDPASVTFPPIALKAKRVARNIYIELSLDEIQRDSDGDGLTDLLEEKLGTDPKDPDTDHDGLVDGVDPLPQVSVTAPADPDVEVMRIAVKEIFGYEREAIRTGNPVGPGETAPDFEESLRQSAHEPGARGANVLFLQADPQLFRGLTLPGRTVFVTKEDTQRIRAKYGEFFPVELSVWFNHARTKAIVPWSAGWTGGTLKFEKSNGKWTGSVVREWVT
jgi:hypothetical protein